MPALWEAAAAMRLPVFPCLPDKKPAIPKAAGGNGFKDATTDPRKIRDMFLAYSAATLIGVATGEFSGLDILDLDSNKHPSLVREWLQEYRPLLPETRAHRTQSGGVHYVFEHLTGLRMWEAKPTKGIDGRADGGYAIWWPAAGYPVNGKPILRWPARLVQQFTKPSRDTIKQRPPPKISEPRLERIIRKVAMASEGERNSLLFWGACRVGEWIDRGEVAREVGEASLLYAARHAGLPDIEALPTILSGLSRNA